MSIVTDSSNCFDEFILDCARANYAHTTLPRGRRMSREVTFGLSLFFGAFSQNAAGGERERRMSNLASKSSMRTRVRSPPTVPWVSRVAVQEAITHDDSKVVAQIATHDPEKEERDRAVATEVANATVFKDTIKYRQDKQSQIDRIKEVGELFKSLAESRNRGTDTATTTTEEEVKEAEVNEDDDDDDEDGDDAAYDRADAMAKRKELATKTKIERKRKVVAAVKLRRAKFNPKGKKSLMPTRDPLNIRHARPAKASPARV